MNGLFDLSVANYPQRLFFPLCFLLFTLSIRAATLPSGFTESQFGGAGANMANPTAMAFAPDGRLFVCTQGGSLRVIKNGALLATPFVTISVNSSGERGLLGVAFDPNFASNQFVYVYYTTATSPIHNRVSRFTANGDVAQAGSETIILELDNLSAATNHNGGALHFGPDGKLYIAVGENALASNAQTLNNLLGKVLRINADGSIPSDNPFFNQATGNNRAIWALGLRNPFTFNFQPGTGRIYINDVGQSTWEEVNDGIAGRNYGWPTCEGSCNNPNFTNPIHQYANDAGTCAIVGAAFYNPAVQMFPAQYVGKYFFADLCGGWIRYLDPASPQNSTGFATGLNTPVDLQVGPDGALYYLQRGNGGQVWRVAFGSNAPAITQHPANVSVNAGQSATFTVMATGAAPLGYQWQRNNVDIPGATSSSFTINSVQPSDNGAQFRAVVSNSFGTATSNNATLTVIANQAPTATITQPTAGTLYSGGQVISFVGTGTDPEDGTLPANRFTWEVVFHHDTHTHPFIQPFSGQTSGTFMIPTQGETAANVWYRIHLTVTDSGGRTHSVFRDINPRTVTLTLQSSPAGLQLTLDGQPFTTPFSVTSVVGIERQLGASSQLFNGVLYRFQAWSDGGAMTHTIATPAVNTTYTATFAPGAASRKSDFDGDGKADLAVWRGNESNWLIVQSGNGASQTIFWGAQYAPYNDVAVPGDYDGDGKTDAAVFRQADGMWLIRRSSDGGIIVELWGLGTDIPVPGDYDGDGKTDLAVWRGSNSTWYIRNSSDGQARLVVWGASYEPYNDVAVPADYDGDGKTDVAVYRRANGTWYIIRSSDGTVQTTAWGLGTDTPVPADYDGDGKSDIAVWRGGNSTWYILRSSNGQLQLVAWGASYAPYNDIAVPADYDGDGRADVAVWRPLNGTWYIINSMNGQTRFQAHGQAGDTPVPATGVR